MSFYSKVLYFIYKKIKAKNTKGEDSIENLNDISSGWNTSLAALLNDVFKYSFESK